jgi:hypothetical protein
MMKKICLTELNIEDFVLALIRGNDYTQMVYDEDFKCCIAIDYHVEFDIFDVYDYLERKTVGYQKDRVLLLVEQMEKVAEGIETSAKDPEDYSSGDYVELDSSNKRFYECSISILKEKVGIKDNTKRGLPKELDTDEAKMYFERAIKIGLMDGNNKWLKGKQMLAWFASKMSDSLKLGKGKRISWKPFETLFGFKPGELRSHFNDIQKTGNPPKDANLIDKVFE